MNQLRHISGVLLLLLGFFITCRKDPVSSDRPPIAKAGTDQTILLPNDTARLSGEGSGDPDDPRDMVTNYYWRKISGPSSSQIDSPAKKTTVVKKLVPGIYHFELKATDVQGLSSTDTVQVNVSTSGVAPIANAGPDDTLVIFSYISCKDQPGSITIDGNRSFDPDHTPLTFLWTQIKGNTVQIVSPQTARTDIVNVFQGDYEFELLVSDAGGKSSKDTVRIKAVKEVSSVDLNISLTSYYEFQDNYTTPYYPLNFSDWVTFSGEGSIPPLGDFHIYMTETSDSSNLSDEHSTNLEIYDGNANGNFLNGYCSVNFKKLIVNGGGSFSGIYTITYTSAAMHCTDNNLNTSPLLIIGTVDTTSKVITISIKGKVYF